MTHAAEKVWRHVEKRCASCCRPIAQGESLRSTFNFMMIPATWNAEKTLPQKSKTWSTTNLYDLCPMIRNLFDISPQTKDSRNTLKNKTLQKLRPKKKSWIHGFNRKSIRSSGKQYQVRMCFAVDSDSTAVEIDNLVNVKFNCIIDYGPTAGTIE